MEGKGARIPVKRAMAVILSFLCLGGLFGCANENVRQENNGQFYFTGKIIERKENTLLVEVTDSGSSGISVATQASVSTKVVSADGCPEVSDGEYIRIVFDGKVLETYPVQLGTVYAIYKTDKTGAVIS